MKYAFLLLLAASLASPAAEKPNVLIFYLDDMAWARPGCYGGKLAPTPNIDALASGKDTSRRVAW